MNYTIPTLHVKQIFIVLAVVLLSFSAKAQIITTVSGGNAYTSASSNFVTACGTNSTGYGPGINSLLNNATITITYSVPVTAVKIPFSSLGSGTPETHRFDVLGQTNEVLSFGCSGITVSGNTGLSSSGDIYFGDATVSSTTPFTQIRITIVSGGALVIPTSGFFNANNLIISPSQCFSRIDLTSTESSIGTPPGTSISWHTTTPVSSANKIANTNSDPNFTDPSSVPAGATYILAFYDASNNCYSPSTVVPTLANVRPSTTVDLTTLESTINNNSGDPNISVQWHTQAVVSDSSTRVLDATQVAAGNYYAVFYDAQNNCYSPAHAAIAGVKNCFYSVISNPHIRSRVTR